MAAGDTPPASSGGGGMLTRKLGPLPTWGWLLIITGLAAGYYLIEKRKTASSATTAATTATSTAASNVPDYVFQNYNQIPPTTPAPAPAATAPAPARQGPSIQQLISGIVGQPAGQSIQTLQQQGWTLGNIYSTSGTSLPKNSSTYGMSVVSYTPHTTGKAGQYTAGSVDLVVS